MIKILPIFALLFFVGSQAYGIGEEGAYLESLHEDSGGVSTSFLIWGAIICGFMYWLWQKYNMQASESKKEWKKNILIGAGVVITFIVFKSSHIIMTEGFYGEKSSNQQNHLQEVKSQSAPTDGDKGIITSPNQPKTPEQVKWNDFTPVDEGAPSPTKNTAQSNTDDQKKPVQKPAAEVESHYRAIYAAHPDADAIVSSKSFSDFLAKQDSNTRTEYEWALKSGSTQQVIGLFNQYKESLHKNR